MKKRIVIGPRANGDVGLFNSPSGVNADTAADASLLLNVSSKVSQLLLMGRVASAGTFSIALALSRSPFVFITSQWDFSAIIGHTLGPGPVRPSPPFLAGVSGSNATINGNGVSMTLTVNYPTIYQVYNQAFT